ncbi:MAG: DUF4124 domain-containing protein [Myxococcales bacterium]|nr:DUF4124 domain-containing protein [Myxococcales bacterium]
MRALPLALIASTAIAQTVYSWTDDEGVVHYTDTISSVPKTAKPSAIMDSPLQTVKSTESSLLRSFDRAHWRTDVPACAKALKHADERRQALRAAEVRLIELTRAWEPCQRYLDICWSRNLSRPTWERECRQRPSSCDVPLAPQKALVDQLREEVQGLPEWLERLGVWGCVK